MRLVGFLACTLMALVLGLGPAHADKRVALVIGIGAYQYADKLANPVNDARRMKDALAKLGFEVVFGEDLNKSSLERTLGRFANVAQDADVALVYFAGHGATFGDTSYVVPVDARFASLAEVPYEMVPVEMLIGELRRAKGLRIAILDACRDNKAEQNLKRTATRGGGDITRGLARVKNPEGLILAYATQYLSTAADGNANGNSPFTGALLNHIATPGLDVKDLFFRVGGEVIATTTGKQRPEISVSFYDSYALVPGGTQATPAPIPAPPPTLTPIVPSDPAAAVWNSIKETTSIAVLEDFIRQYGRTPYGSLARARLAELKKKVANVPPPASAATGVFDGAWTITRIGPCRVPRYQFLINIKGNAVSGVAGGGALTGTVKSDGTITFRHPTDPGPGVIDYTGALRSGSGTFRAPGCSGTFVANRT